MPEALRRYLFITANYWAFTLTDGALRMLVVLHFHQLGYSALQVASLFLFYEVFGVLTNLFGGWLGARWGLNRSMQLGVALQVLALLMLTLPAAYLSVPWVMAAQAFSGIGKDLNKMSAKAGVKALVSGAQSDAGSRLFRWVALLTGSKNALKGVGFFLGAALLGGLGFQGALLSLALGLALTGLLCAVGMRGEAIRKTWKPKFRELWSVSPAINALSAARFFLFAARDVWFVVALPVFLSSQLGWDVWRIGAVLALWVIGYGAVQALAPWLFRGRARLPGRGSVAAWAAGLALVPLAMSLGSLNAQPVLAGLALFGGVFAVNSSLHSFLILAHSEQARVSLDVGFYYMSNAAGRLLGTLLSGALYQFGGLSACLWGSALMLLAAALCSLRLPATALPVSGRGGDDE